MKRRYGVTEVTHYRIYAGGKTFYYTKFIELDDGYAKVMKNDRWGIIDNKGDVVCPLKYSHIGELSNGMIIIYDGYRYGYFSKETNSVWPCIFDKACPFDGDTAKVVYQGKNRIINKHKKFVDEIGGNDKC